jgi:topoisomerase-4 subunit A
MATEIPSHNLQEVAKAIIELVKSPDLGTADILKYLPGPDFSGGGQIISSPAEIASAYETGRGSLKVRARWTIETLARGQWQWVVTELPPGASSQRVLEEIEELTNPKIKVGKKSLSAEQLHTKQILLGLLESVRDESGKGAPVRLVFEPKSSRQSPEVLVNALLTHTSMESNLPLNLVVIGNDGRPCQKSIIAILQEWIATRFTTLKRRSQYRLQKIEERIHILEGRMIVFLNLDEVIRIIRESDEPKDELMQRFALSDRQADDILEIRLRQLARLVHLALEKECAELRLARDGLRELLSSESAIKRLLIREIQTDAKQYGDSRRTLIQAEQRAVFEAPSVDEALTVIVSQNGWVRTQKGHGLDHSTFAFKAGDRLYRAFECRTNATLIALSDNGRVYGVPVAALPRGRGDGTPVTAFIELEAGTHLVHYIAASAQSLVLLSMSTGLGFMATIGQMTPRAKAGKAFITFDENTQSTLLKPECWEESKRYIACLSGNGRLLIFHASEVKRLPNGGRGVMLMALDEGESLIRAVPAGEAGLELSGMQRRGKSAKGLLKSTAFDPYLGRRARRGRMLAAVKFQVTGLHTLP